MQDSGEDDAQGLLAQAASESGQSNSTGPAHCAGHDRNLRQVGLLWHLVASERKASPTYMLARAPQVRKQRMQLTQSMQLSKLCKPQEQVSSLHTLLT